MVENGCSFHGLRSEDPNQHLKDFLKLVDSLDLDGENRERTRLRSFQFSIRDQASNWLERLPAGSISTLEDINTRFLAQFFPPGRTTKLRNDILMFQQHHEESLSEAWTCFKDLLQKVPHHGIDRWLQIQIFYDHEIIENLALYDHKGWDETKEFVKPVKAISTPQGIPKTPDRRLLELEDQINFLLKGSRPTPTSSSAHTSNLCPSPQPQALETTFEARVRDYMAAHTERMERFENTIFKQREEINGRMTEMFGLLKELTTSKIPEKVLIREEAKFPVTKNVNSISLTKGEEERSNKTKVTPDNTEKLTETETEMPVKEVEKMNEVENGDGNKSIETSENEEAVEAPGSQPIAYYLKHKINEKLIKGLVNNNRFNNSRSGTRVGKKKGKEYKVLPGGPAYDAILKKKITKKEDIGGNFKIPCSIGNLKHVNALVDQGSDYIYPLGIAEDVLVEVAEHIFSVDFVILDIKENEKRPFILGTPFLTTAKATIKFDTGTITLRSGKSKIERKNLLIANDNLIDDCLSKEVFYIATNSELTVSRFTKMHEAHSVVQARCLELEAELSKLHDKLKYQNLKESFGNNTSPLARDAPDFVSVFVIKKMKASIQGKDNAIKKLRMQISQLKEIRSEAYRTLDFRALDFHITQLTKKVTVLQEQNDLFRAEKAKN
ncbi:MAK10-like protein [Tanacetum coccineum]